MAQKETPSMMERLQAIDRRWIFLFIMLAVVIPLAFDLTIDEVATPEVQAIYDRIEELPPGSNVLLPFDYGPESEPELQPMADSYVRHLCRRKQKLFFMCLWATGQAQTLKTVDHVLEQEFSDYSYGRDYVMLGFRPGGQGVIQVVVSDFRTLYQSDVEGTPIDEIPIMQNVKGLKDMDLILNISGGFPGLKEWIQFGGDRTGVPVAGGVTAVQAPLLYPYYPRQLSGIMGGLKAAHQHTFGVFKRQTGEVVNVKGAQVHIMAEIASGLDVGMDRLQRDHILCRFDSVGEGSVGYCKFGIDKGPATHPRHGL